MTAAFDTIADNLAENGFSIVDQFLSQKEVDDILSLPSFGDVAAFKKAAIGKQHEQQINEAIRGDYIQWIDKESAPAPVKVYTERISSLIQHLNQTLYLSLKDFEMHLTMYPVGSFYRRHLDQFKKDDHRKISVICYLNKNWTNDDGGQLRMFLPAITLSVLPTAGKLVCFRSDLIEHEVQPATRERLSLTGWILDQYTDLRHL
ncbi:MAG TPA: 2OG-Fe(II) oxygenase [Chryseosolibacter sp.]|nr:2OG-Fe(II) oxygenase [Chryseosolibacter sp.]